MEKMSKNTLTDISATFTQMLKEMSFDRITVSELVKRCGISPNTFYYHYGNIHELLVAWLNDGVKNFIAKYHPETKEVRTILKELLYFCRSNPNIIYNTFNSQSREALERFAFCQSDIVSQMMGSSPAFKTRDIPPEKLKSITRVCKCSLFGYFLEFVWNRMNDDIDKSVDNLVDTLESLLVAELSKYPVKHD